MAENTDPIKLTDEELTGLNVAVKGMLGKMEQYGKDSAEFKAYQDKVETMSKELKKWEDFNNAKALELAEQKKKADEALDRVKHLETSFGVLGQKMNLSPEEKKEVSHKFMNAFFKKGGNNQSLTDGGQELANVANEHPDYWASYCNMIANKKTLEGISGLPLSIPAFKQKISNELKAAPTAIRTDIGEFGGFLPSIEWSTELKSNIFEKSPMRQFCTVKTIGGKTFRQPITVGIPTAQDEGETQTTTATIPNYAMAEITPYRMSALVPITWDALQDSIYNVSAEIMDKTGQAFGVLEGKNCVNGNGVRRALGFVNDKNLIPFTSASSTITFDDLITMTGYLKTGYNPMFFFNRRFAAYLRTLKDTQNRYLWNEFFGSAVAGKPAEINGYSYSNLFIDMDDQTVSNGHAVLFADMKAYYQITDRTDIILIRDEYTQASQAIINFNLMRWTTGQPIITEAAVLMTRNG